MLDPKFIRENIELVKQSLKNKNTDLDLDKFLATDEKRRTLMQSIDSLKSQKNKESAKIAQMVREKKDISEVRKQTEDISLQIKEQEEQLKELAPQVEDILMRIPNIPHKSVPVGKNCTQNKIIKKWQEARKFSFKPKTHLELCEKLGIIDFPRSAKISGSGFALYKGAGARLERGLINFMLDLHTKKHGYTEIFPPFLVNRNSMTGTGQLPKLENDMYRLAEEDLFLVPTAEVPVTNIFSNEILKEENLPIYYAAYSACFRREAGSYGADTKGLKRLHQFNKVELVKFVKPQTSYEEHEKLLNNAETVLQLLNLPYQVNLLCTGDLSFSAAKCYDLEAFAPGANEYLEVSSCSNFEDFQARRAGIRYRDTATGKAEFVHTLNSSGLATPRTMICILENYQQEDCSINIPEVLVPYMDGIKNIK